MFAKKIRFALARGLARMAGLTLVENQQAPVTSNLTHEPISHPMPVIEGKQKIFRLLSMDGGGIRGIIIAVILVAIEELTGQQIWELFDMIAGNSTAALLAVALTRRGPDGRALYTAQQALDLYLKRGKYIFKKSIIYEIIHFVLGGGRYNVTGINSELQNAFGDSLFGDSLTRCMVVTYDMKTVQTYFLKSWDPVDATVPAWVAARGSSAAPTYFDPISIAALGGTTTIDGGVTINSPADCAFAEALALMDEAGERYPVFVVSIGTGTLKQPADIKKVKRYHLWDWAGVLPDIFITSSGETVDYKLRKIVKAFNDLLPCQLGRLYFRFQTELPAANADMDNVDPKNMEELVALAKKIIYQDQKEDFLELCAKLKHMFARAHSTGDSSGDPACVPDPAWKHQAAA